MRIEDVIVIGEKTRNLTDFTKELIEILEESWAREDSIKPYYIYLKMAYHLSQDAINAAKAEIIKDY